MPRQNIDEAVAVLISSTKSKKRPISLIEISKWLELAVTTLDGYKEVANRIGLSEKMLRQFSLVTRLQPKVQQLFKSRVLDSIDAVAHLISLSGKEQILVANMLADKSMDTKDLRAIVQYRKKNPSISIENIVDRVMDSKTKKHYVAEFIIREGNNYNKLMNKFKQYIPSDEIVRLDIDGAIGRLVLTKNGKQELQQIARNHKARFKDVITKILYR